MRFPPGKPTESTDTTPRKEEEEEEEVSEWVEGRDVVVERQPCKPGEDVDVEVLRGAASASPGSADEHRHHYHRQQQQQQQHSGARDEEGSPGSEGNGDGSGIERVERKVKDEVRDVLSLKKGESEAEGSRD